MKNLPSVHIAITLREEWELHDPTPDLYITSLHFEEVGDFFKSTHDAANDPQFLWGYYGNYFHTHLKYGYRTSFLSRDLNKTEWKRLYSESRLGERNYREYIESAPDEYKGY